jgi:hypothetical protein
MFTGWYDTSHCRVNRLKTNAVKTQKSAIGGSQPEKAVRGLYNLANGSYTGILIGPCCVMQLTDLDFSIKSE